MPTAPACPDCGSHRLVQLGTLPDVAFFAGKALPQPLSGGGLMRCRDCDLRLRWPCLPGYECLYDNASVDAWQLGPLRRDQQLVQALVLGQTGAKRVLDFGCYSGGFLAQLPASLEKYGVEVAAAAAEVAARESGATVAATLGQLPSDLRFDVIVTMDVIEHMVSPRALLEQLLARLAPGGSLVITTGDGANALWQLVGARWWYCYFPEHIAFISARWLQFHAAALGARVAGVQTFNYLESPAHGAVKRWVGWLKYLLRPAYHARKRAQHLLRHGWDLGVPGMGLTRDHLLVHITK